MPGVFPDSYFTGRLLSGKGTSSRKQDLESFLTQAIEGFQDRRAFIARLRKSGGRAELFIGLFGTRNFGLELKPELLQSAARMGLTLSLDVYPTE